MGTLCLKNVQNCFPRYNPYQCTKIASQFNFLKLIGRGSYGQVWMVIQKQNYEVYALKIMNKRRIISKNAVKSILKERDIMRDCNNEFIVSLVETSQDDTNLYLLMQYIEGGDMRNYLRSGVSINQQLIKFIILCILQGVNELHSKGILHRDLKPQNVLFRKNGYCCISDFGISTYLSEQISQSLGTQGYMSPQLILSQRYSYQADYYSIGIIAYQLLFKKKPFSENQHTEDIQISPWVTDASLQCINFIQKLLARKPQQRLGHKDGIREILNHPWLNERSINQSQFLKQQLLSPCLQHLRNIFNQELQYMQNPQVSKNILSAQQQKLFEDYDFINEKHINC